MSRKSIVLLFILISFYSLDAGTIDFHGTRSAIIFNQDRTKFGSPSAQINVYPQNSFQKGYNTQNIKNSFVDNFLTYSITPAPTKINHPINLDGNTLHLYGDSTLTKQATIESSGKFNLDGNTIYLDSDFFIPDNTTLTITSSGIIDGQDNTLTLEKRGQILLDSNVSVTFKNLTFKNKLNTESTPPIKCQNSNSQAIFDSVNFAFNDDFHFTEGHFFINNEVNYTGTSQFIYNSTRPSYIQPNSKFKFNSQTSFSYSPSYTTNNNLIVLQEETSCLHFNGSILKTISNGLKLTKGLLYLDNDVTFSSYKENEAGFNLTYSQNYGSSVYSVNWSHDGNYLAVGGNGPDTGHNEIEVYYFNGSSLSFTYSQNYGSNVNSVDWSPDGNYLAVGGNPGTVLENDIEIYSFNGSSLSLTYSQNYGYNLSSVNWSPDGNYLAVGGDISDSGHNDIEIYSFNGSSLSLTYSQNYGYKVSSVNWNPDGNYLAVGGYAPSSGDEIEIYYFNGSSLSLIDSQNYGNSVYSVNWSPDGNYLAIGGYPGTGLENDIEIYSFNGSALSLTDSQNYGSIARSVDWSPDGNYLAVSGQTPDTGHDEIEIYYFNGSSLSLIYSQNYGNKVYSVNWSPDGNYLAIGGLTPDTGHDEIEVYYFKPVPDCPYNITLGNSTLGPEYDLDIKVLGGARVSLDYCNLIYDNSGTTSKTLDFVNRSSSIVLDTKSTFSINRNNIKGWHQQSILRQEGHDNSWTISNTTFGYGTGEIEPGGHLLVNNSNAIVSVYEPINNNSKNIKYNSNAIVLLDEKLTNTYEYLTNKIKENSNTIIFVSNNLQEKIENNSNAIIKNKEDINLYKIKITNNSNAIVSLDNIFPQISENTDSIRENSNAVLTYYNSPEKLIVENSNAIITYENNYIITHNDLSSDITNNSNAIINDYEIKDHLNQLIQNNSYRILYNSNAIIHQYSIISDMQNQVTTNQDDIENNSNAIIHLDNELDSLDTLSINNSNSIILSRTNITTQEQDIVNNSNAIILMETKLTNTYTELNNKIRYNSNAIISLQENPSELTINNSNAILSIYDKIKYNSNGIIHVISQREILADSVNENIENIKNNSNTIITIKSVNEDLVVYNSNLILSLLDRTKYNSNAIIHDYEIKDLLTTATTQNAQKIKENSNAILNALETSTIENDIHNNELDIRYNSNSIITTLNDSGLQPQIDQNKEKIRTNSNALVTIEDDLNQTYTTLIQKITNNSNAIIHDYEIKENLQEQLWNNTNSVKWNSNALLNNRNLININIENIENNRNAILFLKEDFENKINYNSNSILNISESEETIKQNNNSILTLQDDISNKIKYNSNAIIQNTENILITNNKIKYNSNAIILMETKLTNTYTELNNKIKYNSNAIINDYEIKETYNKRIINNSNAIIHDYEIKDLITTATTQNAQNIKENSNTIINVLEASTIENDIHDNELNIRYNSNAIITAINDSGLQPQIDQNKEDIRTNSNALLTIEKDLNITYTTLTQKITNNSNTIIHNYEIKENLQEQLWNNTNSVKWNSNTLLNNRNQINTNIKNIKDNSNAILFLKEDLENQIIYNSNSFINITNNEKEIKQNSNSIITLQSNISNKIKYNSNTLIQNKENILITNNKIKFNSNAIILIETKLTNTYEKLSNRIKYNSNAIINDYEIKETYNQRIINNSNAIIKLDESINTAILQTQINTNKENIENNSNTILYTIDLLGTFPQDITNNSNAIVSLAPQVADSKQSTILTKEPITEDIELNQSVFIHPEQIIEIAENLTIDGKGSVLLFGATDHSQFKVQAGKTVTLKNIQLLRINQKTFDLRFKLIGTQLNDGKIKIGQNVMFGLSENITFSQGLIEILNNDQEEAQLFQLKGIEGQKQFKIYPNDEYANALSIADNNLTWLQRQFGTTSGITSRFPDRFTQNGTVPVLIKCNNNTFGIQNINLSGFEHITKSTSGNYTGALGLLGEADVDVGDDTFTDFEQNQNIQEKYDMVFVTQNLNNSLRILKDDLKFTGQLQFADYGENVLHIDSLLTERIKPKIGSIDPNRKIPQINFATNFIQLTSSFGMGRLIFDDNRIRINNDENGFVAYENSFLGGHTIEVTGDPIWDLYDPISGGKEFILEVDELIGLDDINNQPIISEFYSSLKLRNTKYKRVKTAIDLIYEKELTKLLKCEL